MTAFSVLVVVPSLANARGTTFSKAPEVIINQTFKTIPCSRLQNINQAFLLITLAIIDNSALYYEGDSGTAFIDVKSGTGQISAYVVRKGDSLALIAKMFGSQPTPSLGPTILREELREISLLFFGFRIKHTVKKRDINI